MSKQDKKVSKKIDLMNKYKGVWETTALQLLSVPELGSINSKEIAALGQGYRAIDKRMSGRTSC